jgi:hypothetical protein
MKTKASRVAVPVLCALFLYMACSAANATTNSAPGAVVATAGGDHPFLQAGTAVDASNKDDKSKPSKLGYAYQGKCCGSLFSPRSHSPKVNRRRFQEMQRRDGLSGRDVLPFAHRRRAVDSLWIQSVVNSKCLTPVPLGHNSSL